ncbi:MAG TPA: TonB-dependent receptor [Spirochaetota bacterium]|nr:TonB-dependent receptor [Spirochaetota bacterium]HPI91065.1 TonB-dependent receptor [Spirochaetota bacterium]HPR49850.1 TonB-dependent receptor [Spirochaetota bacterium]
MFKQIIIILAIILAISTGLEAQPPDSLPIASPDIKFKVEIASDESESQNADKQDKPESGNGNKHVITVTGETRRLKDTPIITEVISGEEINESRASTLGDVMEDYGLQFCQNDMGSYIRLQGMDESKVLFMVDGRRISGRIAQRLDADTISVSNIKRIEVVRGPMSVLYGSDGMGGVINIITKKPNKKFGIRGKVANSFVDPHRDTNIFLSQDASANVEFGVNPFFADVHGSFSRSNYHLDESETMSILPRYIQGAGGLTMGITPDDDLDITMGGNYSFRQSDDQTSSLGSYTRKETTRADGHFQSLYDINRKLNLTVRAYYNYYLREKDKYVALAKAWENSDYREEEHYASGLALLRIALTGSNRLTVGFECSYDNFYKYNINDDGSGATKDRDRQSLIIQDEQYKTNLYSVVAGLRVERDSDYGFFAVPAVNGMYYLTRELRLLAGIGMGYRAPDFSDLYLVKDTAGHPVVIGNEDLVPEKSLGVNLGLEQSGKIYNVFINTFYNEIFDEVVNVLQDDQDNGRDVYIKDNLTQSCRFGFDCEARVTLWEMLTLSAGYNLVFGYDREDERWLKDQPTHTVRGRISFTAKKFGFLTYFNGRYQTEAKDLDSNDLIIFDFYVSQKLFEHMKLFAGVNNLTDTIDDEAGLPEGRSFTFGLEAWY